MIKTELPRLADLSDDEFLSLNIGMVFDENYHDHNPPVFESIYESDLPRKVRGFDINVVKYPDDDQSLKLLLVAASSARCGLNPLQRKGASRVKLCNRDFKALTDVIDGWLVAVTAGGWPRTLRFHVIRKAKWIAAGKPTQLRIGIQKAMTQEEIFRF